MNILQPIRQTRTDRPPHVSADTPDHSGPSPLASSFSQLPFDIIEEIIGQVDAPHDLLSMALTCSGFKNTIIPYHIEYRAVLISPLNASLWKHLAEHPRLARNIRKLRIVENLSLFAIYPSPSFVQLEKVHPFHTPTSLFKEHSQEHTQEVLEPYVLTALKNMRRLDVLHFFIGNRQDSNTRLLSHCLSICSLEHIIAEVHAVGAISNPDPLSKMITPESLHLTGLKSLQLLNIPHDGSLWLTFHSALRSSSVLQSLHLPFCVGVEVELASTLADCHFPLLEDLDMGCGWHEGTDMHAIRFLTAHPSIVRLSMSSSDFSAPLPPATLPSIKHLNSSCWSLISSIATSQGSKSLSLSSLEISSAHSENLPILRRMDKDALISLGIKHHVSLETLASIAAMFPAVKDLQFRCFCSAPILNVGPDYTWRSMRHWLSRFRGRSQYNRFYRTRSIKTFIELFPELRSLTGYQVPSHASPKSIEKAKKKIRAGFPHLMNLQSEFTYHLYP